jgi:phosphoglycerol transferase MdoB-like AlkP superfamily enzyme
MKSNPLFRFKLDKKKGLIGFGIGLLVMVMLYLLRDVYIASESDGLPGGHLLGIPLFVLFTVAGFLRIESENIYVRAVLETCWALVSSFAAVFGCMAAVECLGFWKMPLYHLCLSMLMFFAFTGIVYIFTGRFRRSINIASLIQLIIAIINSYVWQFRGREILFSDLSALGTALTVVSEYTPVFSLKMAMGLSLWGFVLFCQTCLPETKHKGGKKLRIGVFVTAVCIVLVCVFGSVDIPVQTWASRGSGVNGFYINFIISIRDAIIREPENYSPAAVEEMAQEYALPDGSGNANTPNIIVIMNESFVDFRVFGDNFNTNIPITPYFDSLQENTVRGYAYTSAYGGHTANSEFEVLTGLTMGLFPVGSIPYQQYISGDVFSLPWLLRGYGYDAFSTHPYFENGWARKTTYPRIGFEESTFLDAYPQKNLIREFVSDQEMYEYIQKNLEEYTGDQPRFIFGITMQNHGGYNYVGDNYTKTVELEGYAQEYPWSEQYLSVLHESDKALEYLLTYLEGCGTDTVVLFFGDHFPGVETSIFQEIHGKSLDTLDEQLLQYKVPFLIWANYDIEEQTVAQTGLNYLSRYLLEAAGLELSPYHSFLKEMETVIPVMIQGGYYSAAQGCFLPYAEAQGIEKEWLDRYEMIQYNALFDEEGRSDRFFGNYLPKAN